MTTDSIGIGAGNEEQLSAWDGGEGETWADNAEFFDGSVRRHHRRLMEVARIGSDDHVLDVGCGTGRCALDAARQAPDGQALGIDLSSPMLAVAKHRADLEGLGNVRFLQGDAQVHPFPAASFDVALSRTAAMFLADQRAAFTNIARALRPGGRLVMLSWRSLPENEWLTAQRDALLPGAPASEPPPDVPSPFRHADPQRTTADLVAGGFVDVAFEPLDLPLYLGETAEAALPVLRRLIGWMVRDATPEEATAAFERLRRVLEEHETPEGVAFTSAAWLITARTA